MEKGPDAFRTISEVADELDVPKHVLRFWEGKFAQLKPMKRGGGRRYYRPEDVALLRGIRVLLYNDGYTIRGVQKLLREQGPRDGRQPALDGIEMRAPGQELTDDERRPPVGDDLARARDGTILAISGHDRSSRRPGYSASPNLRLLLLRFWHFREPAGAPTVGCGGQV